MNNRRTFIKQASSVVAATALFSPSTLMAEKKDRSAETKKTLYIGVIGCRGMGMANLNDFLNLPNIQCLAICDLDTELGQKAVGMVKEKKGNTPQFFTNYQEMLRMKKIDIVVISTPDHWHCLQMVDACAAGKDVYVEKPIANSIAECDAMVAAAKKYGSVVVVGQQQRSGLHWHQMIDYIRTGSLGRISKVDVWANFRYAALGSKVPDSNPPEGFDFDTWLGPTPQRSFNASRFHGSWRMFWNYGGGLMTDWGVHLLDMALWGMEVKGMPRRVVGTGGKFAFPENSPETFDTQNVSYLFDHFSINWSHLALHSPKFGRHYGLAFYGEKGILVANREDWEVIPHINEQTKEPLMEAKKVAADGREHEYHVKNFVDCVLRRDMQTPCTIENGSLCAKYAHLGNIAVRTQSALTYNNTTKSFDHVEANRFIKPEYRKPYQFPSI